VLVAVVMLFVVGAMAALSIDVVTIYTARSEAQLAADGAALAAARALANSGATSDTNPLSMANARVLANAVAIEVGQRTMVGGRYLVAANGELLVSFVSSTGPLCNGPTNPCVSVRAQRTDLPTFFARIWGSRQVTVGATATAEAYNPSGASVLGGTYPVTTVCVKPWVLPNDDPSNPGNPIFDSASGAIKTTTLLGWTSATATPAPVPMWSACTDCAALPKPATWRFYPGDPASFPPPTQALPTCTPALNSGYEESIAGCIQTPIACNATVTLATDDVFNRNTQTARGANCLSHATGAGGGDTVDTTAGTNPPFQFLAGDNNPIPGLSGSGDVMVSDSLVTVPVYNSTANTAPTNPATIIGFVQLFLNPDGSETPLNGPTRGQMNTTVINMAGCGTALTGQPILGNGASPVAVRLVSP